MPVQILKDNTAKLLHSIAELAAKQVLVGIEDPEVAVYAYIQDQGSPLQNIPATHFIERGLENAEPVIASEFQAAVSAAIDDDESSMLSHIAKAGQVAAVEIRETAPVESGRLRDSIISKVEDR